MKINEPFNDVIHDYSKAAPSAIFYEPNDYREGLILSTRGRNTL